MIGNFAAAERANASRRASTQAAMTAQLRWQAADALARAQPPGSAAALTAMLDDPEPAVRLSAARALSQLDEPGALDGIALAYATDFGAEKVLDMRASLLRTALIRFPDDPKTRALARQAAADEDPSVRFLGLVATKRFTELHASA